MSGPQATLLAFVLGLVWSSVPAAAQPIGAFRWQLQPYCNVLTLVVAQQNGVYTLAGTDDRCGGQQSASAVGVVFLNPNGTVGVGLTTVVPGGTPIHLEATITTASLSGTWRDSSGNSGTFVFTPGSSTGGSPRPVASGGVAPGSITAMQLAPGAVGPSAVAPNAITGGHIVDGSLTGADIGNALRAESAESATVVVQAAVHRIVAVLPPFNAPAAGRVIIQASGAFSFGGAQPALAFCSITTGTTVSAPYSVLAQEAVGSATSRFVPFAGMRSFSVAAGSSTTFRLVCLASTDISVWQPGLTALFVAGS